MVGEEIIQGTIDGYTLYECPQALLVRTEGKSLADRNAVVYLVDINPMPTQLKLTNELLGYMVRLRVGDVVEQKPQIWQCRALIGFIYDAQGNLFFEFP